MILDFILLNCLAFFGGLGLSVVVMMAINDWLGLAILIGFHVFANWAWWDVYVRNRRPAHDN